MKTQFPLRFTIMICSILLMVISCKKDQEIRKYEPIKIDTFFHRFGPEHLSSIPYFTDKRFENFAFKVSNGDTLFLRRVSFDSSFSTSWTYMPNAGMRRIDHKQVFKSVYETSDNWFPFELRLECFDAYNWQLEMNLREHNISYDNHFFTSKGFNFSRYDTLNLGGSVFYDVVSCYSYLIDNGEILSYYYLSKKDGLVGYIDVQKKDTFYLIK